MKSDIIGVIKLKAIPINKFDMVNFKKSEVNNLSLVIFNGFKWVYINNIVNNTFIKTINLYN